MTTARRRWFIWLVPYGIVLAALVTYPVFRTLQFSFSDLELSRLGMRAQFVGLDHYAEFLGRREFPTVLRNTVIWVVGYVTSQTLLGLGAALVVNRPLPGRALFRMLIFLPWAIPPIASANLWGWILHGDYGLLNGMLMAVGLQDYTTVWLANPLTVIPVLLIANMWKNYPLVALMLLAALQSIPPDLAAAAQVDGANRPRVFWHVTLPLLRNPLMLVVLLLVVFSINTFEMIFATTGGGPGYASEVMGVHIYRLAFRYYKLSTASAGGVMIFVVSSAITFLYIKLLAQGAE